MVRSLGLILAVPLLAAALLAAAVHADEHGERDRDRDHDHDHARDLYEQGEIRALHDVLRALREQVQGDVVGVELVQVATGWVYRFQVIAPDGRRVVVDIDARPAHGSGGEDD